MQPSSREGKEPIPVDAPVREAMHAICETCAYASDDFKPFRKGGMNDPYFGGVAFCDGYVKVSNA